MYSGPARFGRFDVVHQLGAGVLGPVFLARDCERSRSVAVKVFRLDITPEQAAELAGELGRLALLNLSHQSIVVPIEAGVEGSAAYLVEDHAAGESLDAAIRQYGPAPASQAVRILAGIAGGIDHAAAVGVHHGAIHPRDLLVGPEEVRLTGLGVVGALEAVGLAGPVRRPYTAPERRNRERWGASADVFSLGVLAKELLLGRQRTGDERLHGAAAVTQLQAERIAPVLDQATAARSVERFATAEEFVVALQRALVVGDQAAAPGRRPRTAAASAARTGDERDLLLPLGAPPDLEADSAAGEQAEAVIPGPLTVEADEAGFDVVADLETQEDTDRTFEPDAGAGFSAADALTGDEPVAEADERFTDTGEPAGDDAGSVGGDTPRPGFDMASAEAGSRDEEVGFSSAADGPARPTSLGARRPGVAVLAFVFLAGLLLGGAGGYQLAVRTVARHGAASTPPAGESNPRVSATGSTQKTVSPPAEVLTPDVPSGQAPGPPPAVRPAESAGGAVAGRSPGAVNGRLILRTSPRGVAVALDGEARGLTPLTIGNLAPGSHTVHLRRDGYIAEQRRVEISARRPIVTLDVRLARANAAPTSRMQLTGSLSVDSRPRGARVYLDGQLVGTTPLVLETVPAGSHAVTLERDGFANWSDAIAVARGQRLRVTASLEPQKR